MTKQSLDEAILRWAVRVFAEDVGAGLSRPRSFDQYLSRLVVDALESFSRSEQFVLAELLPHGFRSTHPQMVEKMFALPVAHRNLIEAYNKKIEELREESNGEFASLLMRKRRLGARDFGAKGYTHLWALSSAIFVEAGCRCVRASAGTWEATVLKDMLTFHTVLDLSNPLELSYHLTLKDAAGVPLRKFDHYLGVLGVGPSAWTTESVAEAEAKIQIASRFALWHMLEYQRLTFEAH